MLDELAFLIAGYDGIANHRKKFRWLCYMFEVCRERPVKLNGEKVTPELLHANLVVRLCSLRLERYKAEINEVLDMLHEYDGELYYFVLVATYRLSDEDLCRSLEFFSLKKWQNYKSHGLTSGDIFCFPQLPWDISPALKNDIAVPDVIREGHIEPQSICPVDSRGLLTVQYSLLLRSDFLRSVEYGDALVASSKILFLNEESAVNSVLQMLDGISSDIFQGKDGSFSMVRYCKIGRWSIARGRAVMDLMVKAANRIHHFYRSISEKCASHSSQKLSQAISTAVEEMRYTFRKALVHSNGYPNISCMDELENIVEDQIEFLTICQEILSSENLQVIKLVFTLRCIRDSSSSSCVHAQAGYNLLLKNLIGLINACVFAFVNSGMCDLSDNVFIESVSTKVSPDRTGYGEIWESNLGVELPSSPDLSARLCRLVLKQGVLVRLLNIDIATTFGKCEDLLVLYNIPESDEENSATTELANVLSEIERKFLKGDIVASTLEDLVEWIIKTSPMYNKCCLVASAILRDVRSMCDVIRYLVLNAGLTNIGAEYWKSVCIHWLRAELEARHFDGRHISAIDTCTESGSRRLVITPPEPLSIIITAGHGRRYVRIYTFLSDLTRAAHTLENIELREHRLSGDWNRRLFYYCSSMQRVITGTRDHMLAELETVWQDFQKELNNLSTIDLAINAHRKAMKSMMQRTLLDFSNLTTGRTVGVMCELCVRFAQAINAGDEASAFIHYRHFDEHAQLLREKLNVEKANIYARTLLWRIGNSGGFFDEDDVFLDDDCMSHLPSIISCTSYSLRELSESASQLTY